MTIVGLSDTKLFQDPAIPFLFLTSFSSQHFNDSSSALEIVMEAEICALDKAVRVTSRLD